MTKVSQSLAAVAVIISFVLFCQLISVDFFFLAFVCLAKISGLILYRCSMLLPLKL
jgi:hypothetical protein